MRQISKPEIAVKYYIKYANNFDTIDNSRTILPNNRELDAYIPSIKTGIEFDGVYWHKNKEKHDLEKNKMCAKKHIQLIRVREHGLKPLNAYHCINIVLKKNNRKHLELAIKKVLNLLHAPNQNVNLKRDADKIDFFLSDYSINAIHPRYCSHINEKACKLFAPWLGKYRNYPKQLPDYSDKLLYWNCGHGHVFLATMSDYINNNWNCPYCEGKIKWMGLKSIYQLGFAKNWDYDYYKTHGKIQYSPKELMIDAHVSAHWCHYITINNKKEKHTWVKKILTECRFESTRHNFKYNLQAACPKCILYNYPIICINTNRRFKNIAHVMKLFKVSSKKIRIAIKYNKPMRSFLWRWANQKDKRVAISSVNTEYTYNNFNSKLISKFLINKFKLDIEHPNFFVCVETGEVFPSIEDFSYDLGRIFDSNSLGFNISDLTTHTQAKLGLYESLFNISDPTMRIKLGLYESLLHGTKFLGYHWAYLTKEDFKSIYWGKQKLANIDDFTNCLDNFLNICYDKQDIDKYPNDYCSGCWLKYKTHINHIYNILVKNN